MVKSKANDIDRKTLKQNKYISMKYHQTKVGEMLNDENYTDEINYTVCKENSQNEKDRKSKTRNTSI